jgi:hypothetical protein
VDLSTIQVVFYNISARTLLQQPWLNDQGQLEEGKIKGGIFPLMLSPHLHFQQGQLVSRPRLLGAGASILKIFQERECFGSIFYIIHKKYIF